MTEQPPEQPANGDNDELDDDEKTDSQVDHPVEEGADEPEQGNVPPDEGDSGTDEEPSGEGDDEENPPAEVT